METHVQEEKEKLKQTRDMLQMRTIDLASSSNALIESQKFESTFREDYEKLKNDYDTLLNNSQNNIHVKNTECEVKDFLLGTLGCMSYTNSNNTE